MSNKPNCYECEYRGIIPGDAHSCCRHPGKATELNIKGDPHGVRCGWFMWPMNFDPIWLLNCDGFKQKEVPESETPTTQP